MKIRKIFSIVLVVTLLISSFFGIIPPQSVKAAAVTAFYVATDGNDQNRGTIDLPFATVQKARDAIRELKSSQGRLPAGGVTVYLRGGIYDIADTIKLEQQDSGTPEAPVTYTAYNNEKVYFVGGKDIPGSAFQQVPQSSDIYSKLPEASRNHVVQIDLSSQGITDYGQIQQVGSGLPENIIAPLELFINGDVMTLARYPNEGYPLKTGQVIDAGSNPRNGDTSNRGAVFKYLDDRVENWSTNTGDIWMGGYWYYDYAYCTLQVNRIDTVNKTISTVQPSFYSVGANKRYYYFNVLEELDVPGEWYLDRSTGMMYIYPPKALETSEIRVSTLTKNMIEMNNVSYVTLQGLTLESSRASGIIMNGGTNNRIDKCVIRGLGLDAIKVTGGTGHGVTRCDIYDIGFNGIYMSGGDRNTLTPGGHYVENNHIHSFARIVKCKNAGIEFQGVGLRASHNLLHDSAHFAIIYYGNEHIIENNEIFDVVKETSDAGTVYSGRDWTYKGNILRNNYLHDIQGPKLGDSYGAHAFYQDDQMSSAEIYNNIINNVSDYGFLIGGGNDHKIYNNISTNNGTGILVDDRGAPGNWQASADVPGGVLYQSVLAVPYDREPWVSKYPEIASYLLDTPELPRGTPRGIEITHNIFYNNNTQMNIAATAQNNGTVEDNYSSSDDPGFVDLKNEDFRIRYDSQAYAKGFKEIDFAAIGLKSDFPFADQSENIERLFVNSKDGNTILRIGSGQSAPISVSARTETGYAADLSNAEISYVSNHPEIAYVDAQGIVTGVAKGSTSIIITVVRNGVLLSTEIDVTVDDPLASISAHVEKTILKMNESIPLRINLMTESGQYVDPEKGAVITYKSTNPQVAEVDGGAITAKAQTGTADIEITAVMGGVTQKATLTVEVFSDMLESVALTAGTQAVYEGSTLPLKLAALQSGGQPVDIEKAEVTYRSSDDSVAYVDANGTIRAVSEGSAIVTAVVVSNGEYGIADFKVFVYPDAANKLSPEWRVSYYRNAEGIVKVPDKDLLRLESNGMDVFGAEDDCLFLYQNLTYSGIPQAITAKFESLTDVGNAISSIGVMFRDKDTSSSKNVMMKMRVGGNGLYTWRIAEGGITAYTGGIRVNYPGELMLVRGGATGNTFTAYYRKGGEWIRFGEPISFEVGDTLLAGLSIFSNSSQATVGDVSNVTIGNLPLTGIDLSAARNTVSQGSTLPIAVAGSYERGLVQGPLQGFTVTYTSANDSVASVTAEGMVLGKALGKTIITAQAEKDGRIFTDTFEVTVEPVVPEKVDVSRVVQGIGRFEAPAPLDITAKLNNGNSYSIRELKSLYGAMVELTSSNTGVATIDGDGIVTPKEIGLTSITVGVTINGITKTERFSLIVHTGINMTEGFENPEKVVEQWNQKDSLITGLMKTENPRSGNYSFKVSKDQAFGAKSTGAPLKGIFVGWMYDDMETLKNSCYLGVNRRISSDPNTTTSQMLITGLLSSGSGDIINYGVRNNSTVTPSTYARTKGWHEIVIDNYTTSGKITLYIDGVQIGQYTGYGITSVTFGDMWTGYSSKNIYFDDFAVYQMSPLDNVAPVTEAATDKVPVNGWYNSDVSIRFDAQDNQSGVKKTEYSLDNGLTWVTYSIPVVISSEGANSLSYRSADIVGNVEAAQKLDIAVDKSAPITTPVVDKVRINGWYNSDVSVSLSVYDKHSGVHKTEYSLDNGLTWQVYTGPVVFSDDGDNTLSYRSIDNLGNIEESKVLLIPVNKSANLSEFVIGDRVNLQWEAPGTLEYTSSNQNIAHVDTTGVVTMLSTGNAVVTVVNSVYGSVYNGLSAVIPINVVNSSEYAKLTSISVNGAPLAGFDSETKVYTIYLPEGASIPVISAVAVDPSSKVKVVNTDSLPGMAYIEVKSRNEHAASTYMLNIHTYRINASIASNKYIVGETANITASVLTSNGSALSTSPVISYSSSRAEVAAVDQNGKVVMIAPGSTTITVADAVYGSQYSALMKQLSIEVSEQPFVIETQGEGLGIVSRTAGIKAAVRVVPKGILKQAVVIFQLMDGNTPVDLMAVSPESWEGTKVSVDFSRYSGPNYHVEVYVWDQYDNRTDYVGIPLCEMQVLR